ATSVITASRSQVFERRSAMDAAPQPKPRKASIAGVGAETAAFVAVEEVATNFEMGAETIITGVGGSMIADVAAGDLKGAGVKAVGIAAAVVVRRFLFNRKTLGRIASLLSRGLQSLLNLTKGAR